MVSRDEVRDRIEAGETEAPEEGLRIAETQSEVSPNAVRFGQDGITFGERQADPRIPEWNPQRTATLDDFVLTPEEFRAGFRLKAPLGPPLKIEFTEQAAQAIVETVDYIDNFNPRMAQRLALNPEMMFLVPELTAAVDKSIQQYAELNAGSVVAPVLNAIFEETGRKPEVFRADVMSRSFTDRTPVTKEFWSKWGDWFTPDTADMVATILASVHEPRDRDRLAALAHRYLTENESSLVKSPEAMSQFLFWIYNEGQMHLESAQFNAGGLGGALDNLSDPYRFVQEGVSNIFAGLVSPEEQWWRSALTPGQTAAVSMGLDPSDDAFFWTSGSLDFVGTFVLDPINVAAGVGLGARTAKAFPIATEAANKVKLARILKGAVPIWGRSTTANLPVGARSAWQRVGYHLFARDVDDLLKLDVNQRIINDIANHVKRGGTASELVTKFKSLRGLLGEEGGNLQLLMRSDPKDVEDGLRILLHGNTNLVRDLATEARKSAASVKARYERLIHRGVTDGHVGLDALSGIDYAAQAGMHHPDNPNPVGRTVIMRNATDNDEFVAVWKTAPNDLNLGNEQLFTEGMLDWLYRLRESPEDSARFSEEFRTVRVHLDRDNAFLDIESIRTTPTERTPVQAPSGKKTEPFGPVRVIDEATGKVKRTEAPKPPRDTERPDVRRVRVRIDPEDPIGSLPPDVANTLREFVRSTFDLTYADTQIDDLVLDLVTAATRHGDLSEAKVAEMNARHGLPILYAGPGASFGAEYRAQRVGYKSGKTFESPTQVRGMFAGELPTDITEAVPFLFPRSVWATPDGNQAAQVDDLHRVNSNLDRPIEYVLYTGKDDPKLLDLDDSHEWFNDVLREQIMHDTRLLRDDIFEQEELKRINAFVDSEFSSEATRQMDLLEDNPEYMELFERLKRAREERLGRTLEDEEVNAIIDNIVDPIIHREREGARFVDEAVDRYIRETVKRTGEEPSGYDIYLFRYRYEQQIARQIADRSNTLLDPYPGSDMSRMDLAEMLDPELENMDVLEAQQRAESVLRADRFRQTRAMLQNEDVDELLAAIDRGESTISLLYRYRQVLVTGGWDATAINARMAKFENALRKGPDLGTGQPTWFDGVMFSKNPYTPAAGGDRPNVTMRQAQRAAAQRYKEATADIEVVTTPSGATRAATPEGRRARQAAFKEYQKELAAIDAQFAGPNRAYAFFPNPKNPKYHRIRTGFKENERFLEFDVPANDMAMNILREVSGGLFLNLPPRAQAEVLENMKRLPEMPGLGVPIGDIEDVESLTPPNLGFSPQAAQGGLDPRAPHSLDFETGAGTVGEISPSQLPGPEEAVLRAEFDQVATDAPANFVPPRRVDHRISDQAAEAPFRDQLPPAPTTFPLLNENELDVIRALGDAYGYDSVTLPGGWQIVTRRGSDKVMTAKRTSDPETMQHINHVRRELVEAEARVKWAEAVASKRLYGLKSVPRPNSAIVNNFRRVARGKEGEVTMDGRFAAYVRRRAASLTEPRYPESISITDTRLGYRQLRTMLKHFGLQPGKRNEFLDRYINAKVSQRWGVLSDIFSELADEIGHPMLHFEMKQNSAAGGIQSYFPYIDPATGDILERTHATSRSNPNRLATRPAIPSHLSDVYPAFHPDYYRAYERYRRGKNMPWLVGGLSRLGGTHQKRVESGKKVVNALKQQGVEVDPEEALLFGYANISDEDTLSALTKATRAIGGKGWSYAHRGFTRMQLAARPITWAFRVVVFDEMIRGAIFDMSSAYRHPLGWMGNVLESARIKRMALWRQELITRVNSEISTVFRDVSNSEDALELARRIIPEFDSALEKLGKSADDLSSPGQVKALVGDIVDLDAHMSLDVDLSNFGNRVKTARKKVRRGTKTLTKYGLDADFDWGNLTEISQQHTLQLVMKEAESSYTTLPWRKGGMTEKERVQYGGGYGRGFHTFVTDAWGRIALKAIAGESEGLKTRAHIDLVNSPHWAAMRESILDQAAFHGFEAADDGDLAKWYLNTVLVPHARQFLAPVLGDNPREVALSLLRKNPEVTVGSKTYALRYDKSDPGNTIDVWERIAKEQPTADFPAIISAPFDSRYILPDSNGLLRLSNWLIETFGEKLTQQTNRRPSWLRAYKQELDYLTSRGMEENIAKSIAESEATRRVNHVYFNLKDVPLAVERLNKVIPFFSAMYEVTSSWGYKVPLAQSPLGWPGGVAIMGRKIDRFFDAMIRSGLIQVNDEEDPSSPTNSRQLQLVMSGDLPTNNDLARAMSKGMRSLIKGPEAIVRWLAMLSNDGVEADPDLFSHRAYTLSIGNPWDPGSHGLGHALQLSAGLNPAGSALLGQVRNRSFWAGDNKTFDVKAGTTLGELAQKYDVSAIEILNWNASNWKRLGLIPEGDLNRMVRGIQDSESFVFEDDTPVNIPRSTVVGELLDQVFFPFDQQESGVGTIRDFMPSWSQYMMRGFGIWSAAGEDAPYELMDDGSIQFKDQKETVAGISETMLHVMMPPETQTFMAAEVVHAIQHLEATEGVLTAHFEDLAEYEAMKSEATDLGLKLVDGENGLEELNTDDPRYRELEERLLAKQRMIENHSSMIVKRATEIAAMNSFVRGWAGLFGPGNPRGVYEEAELASMYYESRDAITDARITGSELKGITLPKLGGAKDVESFFELADLWLESNLDDNAPQKFFKEKYPGALPFIRGRTYWGPGGEPVRSQSYDDYVDAIRRGDQLPYTPMQAMVMQMMMNASIEREVDIIEKYGNDPLAAAEQILANYHEYTDKIANPYQTKRDAIAIWDSMMGGEYEEWRERTRENWPLLVDDWEEEYERLSKDLELAQASLDSMNDNTTSDELLEITENLKASAAGVRRIRAMFEQRAEFDDRANNPREDLISQYFNDVMGDYWDQQAIFADRLAEATTTEDRSRIFTEKRMWENSLTFQPVYINWNGGMAEVPNGLEYYRVRSSEEESEQFASGLLNANPRWNNMYRNSEIVRFYPKVAEFLPTTWDQMNTWDVYDATINRTRSMEAAGEITESEGTKIRREAKLRLSEELAAQGREAEAWYMLEAWPAERMYVAGLFDKYPTLGLRDTVATIQQIKDLAEANEMSPRSQDFMPVYLRILDDMQIRFAEDPGYREELTDLMKTLGYEHPVLDKFFAEVFLGMFNDSL